MYIAFPITHPMPNGATALSIRTLSIMTFSITIIKYNPQYNCRTIYSEVRLCWVSQISTSMLSVVMLSVGILSIFKLCAQISCLCWMLLCWVSLCWVSLCWVSLCWVSWCLPNIHRKSSCRFFVNFSSGFGFHHATPPWDQLSKVQTKTTWTMGAGGGGSENETDST